MLKYMKWLGVVAVVVLIYSAFEPWATIPSLKVTITGMDPAGTNFGKPALMNIFMSVLSGILFLVPFTMAKRANLFFCGFNVAWAVRNFIILSICHAGECLDKHPALYVMLVCSIIAMIASLFPDLKLTKSDSGREVDS